MTKRRTRPEKSNKSSQPGEHRDPAVISAEREELERRHEERVAALRREEDAARWAQRDDRGRKWKEAAPPVVAAWRLTLKRFSPGEDGFRVMYTVRYADGTGNTFHPVRGAYDETTGRITDRSVPLEPFFVHGLPFDSEVSGWLSDDHFYDIVRVKPAKMPPIDRS